MHMDRGGEILRCSSMPPDCSKAAFFTNGEIADIGKEKKRSTTLTTFNPQIHSIDVHTVCTSPVADLSIVTDEDSGYCQTPCVSSCKQSGSTGSIANSGPVNSDDTGGSSVNCRDELLHIMTEDLVDWFMHMYPEMTNGLDAENFFDKISDGVLLCHHASELHDQLNRWSTVADHKEQSKLRVGGMPARIPCSPPVFQSRGLQGSSASMSFVSRANLANFLIWCRQLGMPDSVLFESEDVVSRKNLRNVAVCLLELARLGGRVGMEIPGLVQLEDEIDREIAIDGLSQTESDLAEEESGSMFAPQSNSTQTCPKGCRSSSSQCNKVNNTRSSHRPSNGIVENDKNCDTGKKKISRPIVDMRSLDEMVRDLLAECTCEQMFPMRRVGEGRYLFGDKQVQIFVRILRSHVMVRVGGGWDTLNHFLSKYDGCRKINPPNCKLSSTKVNTESSPIETTEVESLLNTKGCAPPPPNSPIKNQGLLNVVKRSPTKSTRNNLGEKPRAQLQTTQAVPYNSNVSYSKQSSSPSNGQTLPIQNAQLNTHTTNTTHRNKNGAAMNSAISMEGLPQSPPIDAHSLVKDAEEKHSEIQPELFSSTDTISRARTEFLQSKRLLGRRNSEQVRTHRTRPRPAKPTAVPSNDGSKKSHLQHHRPDIPDFVNGFDQVSKTNSQSATETPKFRKPSLPVPVQTTSRTGRSTSLIPLPVRCRSFSRPSLRSNAASAIPEL